MKNAYAIGDLAGLMAKTCDTIGQLSMTIGSAEQNDNEMLIESYKGILLNELENLQHMTISLTQFVTDIAASDEHRDDVGTVFQQGELDDDLGDKTERNVVTIKEEEE